MDAPYYNGGPEDIPMASSNGDPEPWKCLDCEAAGKGYVSRAKHWYATGQGHHIVWGLDPRAKTAPKQQSEPEKETDRAEDIRNA